MIQGEVLQQEKSATLGCKFLKGKDVYLFYALKNPDTLHRGRANSICQVSASNVNYAQPCSTPPWTPSFLSSLPKLQTTSVSSPFSEILTCKSAFVEVLLRVRITHVSHLLNQTVDTLKGGRDHILWGMVLWPGRWLHPSVGCDEQMQWVWDGRMDASYTSSCHVPSLNIQTHLRRLQLSTNHGRTGSLLASYLGHGPGAPFWLFFMSSL